MSPGGEGRIGVHPLSQLHSSCEACELTLPEGYGIWVGSTAPGPWASGRYLVAEDRATAAAWVDALTLARGLCQGLRTYGGSETLRAILGEGI
mmetsp:Transcript_62007/g.196044  ORF Transcript_62007/g.196044 Transcript_62007/m.196044 type:complete len:93 (+) Transcript_62007:1354-1632(+)